VNEMMKRYLTIAVLIISACNMQAQYIFSNCGSHPAFGDSLVGNLYDYDTTGIISGSPGANRIWNYSNLSLAYTWPLSHYYFDPAGTQGKYMFPNAEVADRGPSGVFSYLKYSYDSVTFFGDYLDSVNYHQSWDPQKNLVCSLSYGNSFSDFFSRYNFSQCPYHHTYTTKTVSYDGYGTIYLPQDTFAVARLKIVENTLDTAICVGPPVISFTIDTTYIWYDINTNQPVFSWHYFYDTVNVYKNIIIQVFNYTHLPVIEAGVNEPSTEMSIRTYPNPTSGKFSVDIKNDPEIKILTIYNVFGEQIFKSQIAGRKPEVDISDRPNGIYFLNLLTENGTYCGKIILSK
jgi:hypothetical protein